MLPPPHAEKESEAITIRMKKSDFVSLSIRNPLLTSKFTAADSNRLLRRLND
jgi:hypothetical protein